MIKNLILLGLLAWMTTVHAKVVQDTMADAEAYKVEKPSHEQEAKRSLAGGKIKKKRGVPEAQEAMPSEPASEPDSEVRYWKYSEE